MRAGWMAIMMAAAVTTPAQANEALRILDRMLTESVCRVPDSAQCRMHLSSSMNAARVEAIGGTKLRFGHRVFQLDGIRLQGRGRWCTSRRGHIVACEEAARRRLERAIRGQVVRCVPTRATARGRAERARCTSNGHDLARIMVRSGHAARVGHRWGW